MAETPNLNQRRRRPCRSRQATLEAIKSLSARSPLCNVFGDGPLLVSNVPVDAQPNPHADDAEEANDAAATSTPSLPARSEQRPRQQKSVVLGIDEAGRGSVLGPMVYGAAYWCVDDEEAMSTKGFDDSKALTAEARSAIFDRILETPEVGFVVRILHASEISRNMLNADAPYNLNAMSHDAAISMIRAVLGAGVKLERVYIDTVGIASSYQAKLERVFDGEGIQFTVEKKADSKYASCAAASITAKVLRDRLTSGWTWSERHFEDGGDKNFGSGYPSDPKCKAWLQKNLVDPVFCFPDMVRFSWAPAKLAVKERGALIEWEADDKDEEGNGGGGDDESRHQQTNMSDFFASGHCEHEGGSGRKKPRLAIFEEMGLSVVGNLIST